MYIDEQKTRFLGICCETIHREGLEELLRITVPLEQFVVVEVP